MEWWCESRLALKIMLEKHRISMDIRVCRSKGQGVRAYWVIGNASPRDTFLDSLRKE